MTELKEDGGLARDMSLRDRIAIQILPTIFKFAGSNAAKLAYETADKMLAERKINHPKK